MPAAPRCLANEAAVPRLKRPMIPRPSTTPLRVCERLRSKQPAHTAAIESVYKNFAMFPTPILSILLIRNNWRQNPDPVGAVAAGGARAGGGLGGGAALPARRRLRALRCQALEHAIRRHEAVLDIAVRWRESDAPLEERRGTPAWLAPELRQQPPALTSKVAVWGLGVAP